MKIYISGKITGTDDYIVRFKEAELELKRRGYTVVNPAAVNAELPEDTTWEEYMEMSKVMLGMCDEVYMLEGWEDSKGACIEFGIASKKGMKITYQREDIRTYEIRYMHDIYFKKSVIHACSMKEAMSKMEKLIKDFYEKHGDFEYQITSICEVRNDTGTDKRDS